MITRRFTPLTAVLLTTIACGPPGFEGASTTDDTTTDDTTAPTDADSTTTDTQTSDEGSVTSVTSTTSGFVPEYDEQPPQCDSFMQDCPEGEKCVPYGSNGGNWDASKCVAILGSQATGEPCVYGGVSEATDDCDGTGYCWNVMEVDGEAIGTCHAFCTGTPDDPECPPNSQCSLSGDGTINLCILGCDPLIQDCGEGLACYWAHNGFQCILTTQNVPIGQPCGYINDCDVGLICLNADAFPACAGVACCSAFCELELGDGPCDAALPGTVCVPFFEDGMAPPGLEPVGICTLPP